METELHRIDYIWNDDETDVADRYRMVSEAELAEQDSGRTARAEQRLGVAIPRSLQVQMIIQDGGVVGGSYCGDLPFRETRWANSVIDGILPLAEWEPASGNDWFESFVPDPDDMPENPVVDLDKLVIIAAQSESQLCLDYRQCGQHGMPRVVYIDVSFDPMKETVVADTVDKLVAAMVASRT